MWKHLKCMLDPAPDVSEEELRRVIFSKWSSIEAKEQAYRLLKQKQKIQAVVDVAFILLTALITALVTAGGIMLVWELSW